MSIKPKPLTETVGMDIENTSQKNFVLGPISFHFETKIGACSMQNRSKYNLKFTCVFTTIFN